jgi:hypothetical protein
MTPRRRQVPDDPPRSDEFAIEDEDLEPLDEVENELKRKGGWSFFLLSTLLSLGVIGWGIWALRGVVENEYFDRLAYAFQDVELAPGADFGVSERENRVRVYFTHDGRTLTPDTRRLPPESRGPRLAALILNELLDPPRNVLFRSALPEGTRVRGVYRIGRTAYVDCSAEFINPPEPTPNGERLAVYAVVNSIALNDPEVDAVQILIEGREIGAAWGWLDCSSPLGANLAVID